MYFKFQSYYFSFIHVFSFQPITAMNPGTSPGSEFRYKGAGCLLSLPVHLRYSGLFPTLPTAAEAGVE